MGHYSFAPCIVFSTGTVSIISGKILENLTLGPPRAGQSPPSQPPTPPSTPLSPRSGADCFHKYTSNPQQTTSSPVVGSLPQNLSQRVPLNLVGATKKTSNGAAALLSDYGGGGGYMGQQEVERKMDERSGDRSPGGSSQSSRVSFVLFPSSLLLKTQV